MATTAVGDPALSMDMEVDPAPPPPSVPVPPRVRRDPPQRASSVPVKYDDFTVGVVYSSEMMLHFCPSGHPETPERIERIFRTLEATHLLPLMKRIPIRPVRKEESLLVHSEDHWDKVRDIASE